LHLIKLTMVTFLFALLMLATVDPYCVKISVTKVILCLFHCSKNPKF